MMAITTTIIIIVIRKIVILLIILSNFYQFLSKCNEINENQTIIDKINCRERNRLIQNDNNDFYKIIDATVQEKIILQCHYWYGFNVNFINDNRPYLLLILQIVFVYLKFSKENDDDQPKIWYKIDNFTTLNYREVQLDMNNDPTKNRIHINVEHSLIINNFTQNDTGLYTCQRLNDENVGEKFNYYIDLVFDDNLTEVTGNLSDWLKYRDDFFQTINDQFQNSQSNEFQMIRDRFNLEMEVITQWEEWGPCQVCGSLTKNHGIRRKSGLCRVKIIKNQLVNQPKSDSEKFLRRLNMFGCHSEIFSKIVPSISNMTRTIPDFIQIQPCEGVCNPGADYGWRSTKNSSDYRYRKTVVLAEGEHKNFICPESTLDNIVTWKKNGNSLESGRFLQENPDTLVDTFGTIYFTNVKMIDEANYTCDVDNVKMQRLIIFVAKKSKIFNQVFVRYVMYLTIILSLVLPCYIGGLIIACSRRHFFKDYQQLKDEEIEFEGVLTLQR